MTGNQKFATIPIVIVAQDTTEVTFSVTQSWLDHPACFVATDYVSTSNVQTCEREDNVAPGEIDTYTAICINGVAQVTIYVHSSAFDTVTDTTQAPERCTPVGDAQTVAYTFDVPCAVEDGACAPTPELTCDDFFSQIISSENFDTSGDTQSWLFAVEGSSLRLSADSPEVSKTFEVPMNSPEITLEFDFYENGAWASADEVYIRINDMYIDLISYTSVTSEGTKTGTFGELAASVTTSGSTHHVQLTIPVSWYPDGRLPIGFKVTTSKLAAEAFGFDNVMLSSACETFKQPSPSAQPSPNAQPGGSPSSAPAGSGAGGEPSTAAPSGGPGTSARPSCTRSARPSCTPTSAPQVDDVTCSSAHTEDFENDQALTWVNGLEAQDLGFTTFLGRLGKENSAVSKTFTVPRTADKIIVEFDLYSIDGHSETDKVLIGVQGTFLDLNLFVSRTDTTVTTTTTFLYNDINVTIEESRSYDVGFGNETDQKFHIKLELPKAWHGEGELAIGFEVEMTESVTVNAVGVDNFEISAECGGRRAAEERNLPGLEPSDDAEDGSFYCLSDDFPCEDGANKVNVCHYSTRRGYQTFCIPETDSEILRFYANDYCGPCIGGYGGAGTA
jgi:hypothetical protein